MGWFLSRKRKRGQVRPLGRMNGEAKAHKPWNPQRTMVGLQILVVLGMFTLAAFGWHVLGQKLRHYVASRESAPVAAEGVQLVDAPAWMSPLLRRELADIVAGQVCADPLNGNGLEWAAEALAESPWVARVHEVRRVTGPGVQVKAEYRTPKALIYCEDGYRLVDAGGIRLPGLYMGDELKRLRLPILGGVSAGTPAVGTLWLGEDVQAGLALVKTLAGETYHDQIGLIDVSRRDARGRIRLVLLTTTGGMVRWGLPPGQERAIEPDAATKRSWLASVFHQQGQIDAGGRVVDVYGPAVLIHQPDGEGERLAQIGYH